MNSKSNSSGIRNPSRRDFLRSSIAAAVLARPLGIHAAGTERLRLALVGCGGRGTGAVSDCLRVSESVRVVALADVFEDRAQASLKMLRELHPSQVEVAPERVFVGFDAYKKAVACDVDLVLCCTPPGFRPLHYKAAIEAGRHAFLEKPVCVDAAGYRSVVETSKLADQKGLKVCVGYHCRHQPEMIEWVKHIHDGDVGQITFLQSYSNFSSKGFVGRAPDQKELEYQLRNWHHFVWLCGDDICEGAPPHVADLVNWVMRDEHPVEANAMGGRQVETASRFGQSFDHHFVEFTYANGVKWFFQCRRIPGCWSAGGSLVHGTEGVAGSRYAPRTLTPWGPAEFRVSSIVGKRPWKFSGRLQEGFYDPFNPKGKVLPTGTGHHEEQWHLIDAIVKGKPFNEGHRGADSSMTVVLARMASYSGQLICWDDAVAKGPSLVPETLTWDSQPPVLPDKNGNYPIPMPGIYKPF